MKKNIVVCLILIFSLLLAVTGYKNINKIDVSNTQSNISVDYPTAYDINNMIDNSSYIVKGNFTKYVDSWNMARNPENLKEEDTQVRIEGRLYEFVIEKELKGNLSKKDIITINLPYSHMGNIDELYVEPTLNEKVILFLKYDSNFDYYYPAIEPYQFIEINDELKVKSNDKKVVLEFDKKEKKVTTESLEKLLNNK